MSIKFIKDKINNISNDDWILIVLICFLIGISFGYMLLHI